MIWYDIILIPLSQVASFEQYVEDRKKLREKPQLARDSWLILQHQ